MIYYSRGACAHSSRRRLGCGGGRRRGGRASSGGRGRRSFGGGRFGGCSTIQLRLIEHLALEDPHLDANHAISGARLGQSVVDVGTEGVQRNATLAIPLGARDFRSIQAP